VDGLSVGDTSQDVLDERTDLGSQGFASVAAAIDLPAKKLVGKVAIEMHGITGGDDAHLAREANAAVTNAIQNALRRDKAAIREIRRDARNKLSSILWDRTKQKPMIVVNLLEV